MDMIRLVLVGFFVVIAKAFEEPSNVLTLNQRINIFGTNCSEDLPPIKFVTIQRLPMLEGRLARKIPVNLLKYKLNLDDEDIILTLRRNKDLLSPGCVVHKHQRNGYKIIYPCGKGTAECLFTGKSDNHAGSWAAVNTCYGLKGVISFHNTSLVIAPLNRKRQDFSENNAYQNEIHVVYRYESKKAVHTMIDSPITFRSEPSSYRTKRDALSMRYIESSVIIDPSLNDMYQARAEEYTQTSFNVASKLYEHKSLGTIMKLCLSEIHIFESYDSIKVPFTTDAKQILDDVCPWHTRISTTTPDCTVIFTRQNVKYKGISSYVGLAYDKGMCQKDKNCAVVEDTGPTSGETIAHEIGHLLGLRHDNFFAECNSSKTAGVMVEGATGQAAFRWSTCSARDLKTFLRNNPKKTACLTNKPKGAVYSIGYNASLPKPGTIYSRDEQCRMIHGHQASYCHGQQSPDMICGNLLCRPHSTADCYYLSQVLDGTDCNNTRTWCMSAKCVAMDASDSVTPRNGGWTDWGSFGTCSRTCGGGVKIMRRSCTNPVPQFGGRNCEGPSIHAKICNLQACVGDFKRDQCIEKGNTDWVAVEPSLLHRYGLCQICCSNKANKNIFIKYQNHYKDGTECSLKEKDGQYARCVEGKCRSFGCDANMDSKMANDKCGVCNGTGEQCQRTFGNYEKNGPTKGVIVNGQRVINPDNKIQTLSDTYLVHGMSIKYTRRMEKVEIDGPTTSNIIIQVYQRYSNYIPRLVYEFYSRGQEQPSKYHWSVDWSECTKTCGTGTMTPKVRCLNLSSDAVEDFLCDIKTKPSEIQKPCNDFFCPPEWKMSSLSSCSVTCGDGGIRSRSVYCVQEKDDKFVFRNGSCDLNTKPSSFINCSYIECPGVWSTGPWSGCSEDCGKGKQTRSVSCTRSDGSHAEEKICVHIPKPDSSRICVKAYCPNMPYGPDCIDEITNCKDYGPDACYAFRPWAMQNCMRTCAFCSPDDNSMCKYQADILGINPCIAYPIWAEENCRYMCNLCVDKPQCSSFLAIGVDICGPDHVKFGKEMCPNMCDYCGPCRDMAADCEKMDKSFCATSLVVRARCREYCGLCRH